MALSSPSPERNCVYHAAGLKKAYDDGAVQALRGVDFQIFEGEFTAIIGQSGSGKSTLLQMLGALDTPSEGTLFYRGKPLSEWGDLSTYRAREVGFVFQAFHLLPAFTVLENVQIPMFETEMGQAQRRDRAIELLKSVGLEHRLNHFPGKLSGGERQRAAIARSLGTGASILLADEPTGNLDSESAKLVIDLLSSIREERNLTLVLVTHDMGIARQASRVIEMKDGRIVPFQSTDFLPALL